MSRSIVTFFCGIGLLISVCGCVPVPDNPNRVPTRTPTVSVPTRAPLPTRIPATRTPVVYNEFGFSLNEQERIEALLSENRIDSSLTRIDPLLPADAVGARAAIGYSAEDIGVWLSVYGFEKWGDADADAIERLTNAVPEGDFIILHTSNGALTIFAYGLRTGDEVLDRFHPAVSVISAFAGDE